MINFKEIEGGEDWELFARDFLKEIGFRIESEVSRGADAGKDLIISETTKGIENTYRFRWLVSCKHYATSDKSINEVIEPNLLERCKSFNVDGFIGFYSTLASSGLVNRLDALKAKSDIREYQIYDRRKIESILISKGFSFLCLRYFPESYKRIKPRHQIFSQWLELKCDCCHKDLLDLNTLSLYQGLISFLVDEKNFIHDIYFACKGDCNNTLESKIFKQYGYATQWEDISDLIIPAKYLQFVLGVINEIHNKEVIYTDISLQKLRYFLASLGQIVFREMTEKERERLLDIQEHNF
ncbi:MAG: restriction endonuclease [Dolichospermum sp.]